MCWVSWAEICKPKKEGGLGIKDLRLINCSLLSKWRWKLLMDGEDLWKKVIMARYGRMAMGNANLVVEDFGGGPSAWWRDICRVDSGTSWFSQATNKKVGNGNLTKFWKDVWIGEQSLENRFPHLFGISLLKDSLVCEAGRWENGTWNWALEWRRQFFAWEVDLLQELLEVLACVVITDDIDIWIWKPGIDGVHTVRSTYIFLDNLINNRAPRCELDLFAFKFIWKSGVPSKVSALSWQMFLKKIPTRENLRRRGILNPDESRCVFCGLVDESASHLFLHCKFTTEVWYALMRWLGVVLVLPSSISMSYAMFVGNGSNKQRRKDFSIIWLSFIWGLWKVRNDRVFNNITVDVSFVVDLVQRLSWQWFLNNTAKGPCLLYEWTWNPGDCMLR
ncbi:hypothetical protein P8452_52767 [Trifolium repens]|nr:hypothetical protein P8452_52767 [Trifolium repens]